MVIAAARITYLGVFLIIRNSLCLINLCIFSMFVRLKVEMHY